MSDLSGLDRSFGLPAATMPPPLLEELAFAATRPVPTDVFEDEVRFRPLRTAQEIARILHLRSQIALPASAVGDASFALREKKEMTSGWSEPSCGLGSTSGPSASCR